MQFLLIASRYSLAMLLVLIAGLVTTTHLQGQITLNTTSLDFGTCTGDTILQTFIITNAGTAETTVSFSQPDKPFFLVQGGGSISLGLLETRQVRVGYTGSANANPGLTDSSHIQINYTTGGPVPVSGSVVVDLQARCPDGGGGNSNDSISFSLQSLDFGGIAVGGESRLSLSIDNNSASSAMIAVGTVDKPFSIASGGGISTVAPGASHTIEIVASPDAAGTFNATLPIVYRSGDNQPETLYVALSATGKVDNGGGDVLSISGQQINFGRTSPGVAVQQEITLQNIDPTNTIRVDAEVSGAESAQFAIQSGGGEFSLNPQEKHTVMVQFMPSGEGAFSDSIAIEFESFANGVSLGTNRRVILLTGESRNTSQEEGILNFSVSDITFNDGQSITIGSVAEETIQISNPGNEPIDIRIDAPNLPFSLVGGDNETPIMPGETREIVVRYAPTTPGDHTGVITVNYGTANRQQQILLQGRATGASSGVQESEEKQGISIGSVTPNPVTDMARFALSIEQGGTVSIRLYNSLGETVTILPDRVLSAGTHTITLNLENVLPGIYYCRITTNGSTQTTSLMVAR